MVPVLGPKRAKLGPQRQKGIYIGYDSTSIIRYLERATADVFKARFLDCDFYEDDFPQLSQTNQPGTTIADRVLAWTWANSLTTDPRTKEADESVRRVLHLQQLLIRLPDAFNDAAGVTKSHIEAANAPARIQPSQTIAATAPPKAKRGRPPGSKDQHLAKGELYNKPTPQHQKFKPKTPLKWMKFQ